MSNWYQNFVSIITRAIKLPFLRMGRTHSVLLSLQINRTKPRAKKRVRVLAPERPFPNFTSFNNKKSTSNKLCEINSLK